MLQCNQAVVAFEGQGHVLAGCQLILGTGGDPTTLVCRMA